MKGIKTTEIYSYCSGGQKSEIKVLAGLAPTGGFEGESIPCLSSSFWMAAGNFCCPLAYRHTIPISALSSYNLLLCVSSPFLFFSKDTYFI